MHLDLKPENMMFFPESNGESVLKAINFGSTELLKNADGSSSNQLGNRANLSLNIDQDVGIGTRGYNSPEISEHSWAQSAVSTSNQQPLKVIVVKNFIILNKN
jgi:serine/threonine protein kinase